MMDAASEVLLWVFVCVKKKTYDPIYWTNISIIQIPLPLHIQLNRISKLLSAKPKCDSEIFSRNNANQSCLQQLIKYTTMKPKKKKNETV